MEGRAPTEIWPDLFHSAHCKEDSIKDVAGRHSLVPLREFPSAHNLMEQVHSHTTLEKDVKQWKLSATGVFTVKSFYNFLVDGGLRCGWTSTVLKGHCPKKINLFNWLARDNKILTLENLALRRCNLMHSITCVLCHTDVESADHLLIHCLVAYNIWNFFGQLLGLSRVPRSLVDLWGDWRKNIKKSLIFLWDLLTRAITWNLWLERNACIFSCICNPTVTIISKIAHMLLL